MADYLSEEEQLARLRGWWAANGTFLVLAIVVAIALVIGWRWYQGQRAAASAAGSALYQAFASADVEVRPGLIADLDDQAAGTAYPVLARLELAKAAMEAEPVDLEGAATALEAALSRSSEPTLKSLVLLRLARVHMQQGDSAAALARLKDVRGEGYLSLVAELTGDIHMAEGRRSDAHSAYQQALERLDSDDRRPVLELKAATTAAELASPLPATRANDDSESDDDGSVDAEAAAEGEATADATGDTE